MLQVQKDHMALLVYLAKKVHLATQDLLEMMVLQVDLVVMENREDVIM